LSDWIDGFDTFWHLDDSRSVPCDHTDTGRPRRIANCELTRGGFRYNVQKTGGSIYYNLPQGIIPKFTVWKTGFWHKNRHYLLNEAK